MSDPAPRPKPSSRGNIKRETDLQIISGWIAPKDRVLDLGCGRGILLEHLAQTKGIFGVGVDLSPEKVLACVRRGVPVYQGDAEAVMGEFPDGFFDWVICSRTLPEMPRPAAVVKESLRVGRSLAVGFANHGYWRNRLSYLCSGRRLHNEVFPDLWHEASPTIDLTVGGFEDFCRSHRIQVRHRVFLRGDWRSTCRALPQLRAGYAVYALTR